MMECHDDYYIPMTAEARRTAMCPAVRLPPTSTASGLYVRIRAEDPDRPEEAGVDEEEPTVTRQ